MVKTLYSILHRSLDLTEFMEEVLIDDNMVFDIDNLKGFLNDTSSFGFIAKENNKIIGFAYCYTLLRPDGKTMFYLHSIGMLPNYQDKGYGSKLLSFIKEYSKEIGCSEMFLITDKGNPRACHVYEKLGGKNDYKDEIIELNYEVYKYRTYSSMFSATALILYFGVLPLVMNGQTLGKKIMKLRVVSNNEKKLNFWKYLIRIVKRIYY